MRKDFQELSPAKEVIAEVSTHLLCKRLHYVLSVNRIHTRVFLSVNQIQTTMYDYFYDSHSSDANGQMTIMTGAYILSIPSTSVQKAANDFFKQIHFNEPECDTLMRGMVLKRMLSKQEKQDLGRVQRHCILTT